MPRPDKRIRKSSVRSVSVNPDKLDFTDFIEPYIDIKKEYEGIIERRKQKDAKKAYVITFRKVPNLVYIAFEKNKDKAKGKAVMFYREFHPCFIGEGWKEHFRKCSTKRNFDLDKYAEVGKVPIPVLFKLGLKLKCTYCGNHTFSYSSYKRRRCFIIEGEPNPFPFVDGVVLCYNCKKEILG